MKTEIKELPKSHVSITVELDPVEFKKYYDDALMTLAANLKIAGFRKGKAPRALVENHFGPGAILAEAADKAIPQSYYLAVSEHKLQPLSQPEVSVENLDESLKFKAEVDVLPQVQIKEWQKIRVKRAEPKKIKDDEVEKIVAQLRKERARLAEMNRPLATGDFASISYEGSIDGVVREDMASKNHPLILGEGGLIPGFEGQLMGLKEGDEKEFDITFPKDYPAKDLARKRAHFKVKIDSVKGVELPEIDEQFLLSFGQKNIDDFKKAVHDQLEQAASDEAKHQVEEAVLAELVKRTRTLVPQSLVEREIDRFIDALKERMGMDEIRFSTYLEKQHKTLEEFRTGLEAQAEKNVMISLALAEIIKELEIDPKDQSAVNQVLNKLVESATK